MTISNAIDAWRGHTNGLDHPDLASCLNTYGEALLKSHYVVTAKEKPFHEALGMAMRVLGKEHPEVARSLVGLGLLRVAEGGEAMARQGLEMRKRVYGEGHPEVRKTIEVLRSAGLDVA